MASHSPTLSDLTGPWSGTSYNSPPQAHTHSCAHTHRGLPARPQGGWSRAPRLTHRVGLLCARSHVALGILMGLDQQLDEAGNDCCLLQWGMVGWAQGQIPDQANGCLARKGTTIRVISWVSGGSQFPSISSSPSISLTPGRTWVCWKVSQE